MEEAQYNSRLYEVMDAICKGVRIGVQLGVDPDDVEEGMARIYPHIKAISWYDEEDIQHIALMGEALRLFGESPDEYMAEHSRVM